MEKIEFEQDNINAVDEFKLKANLKQRQVPAMVKFLVKTGIAKDEKTAKYFLIGIAACSFIASGIIFYFGLFPSKNNKIVIPPEILLQQKKIMQEYQIIKQ
ncbi:MAG: hypothetical protein WCV55_03740 [Candidatus Paceibacterota bacterium]